MISCDPAVLMRAAACFNCGTSGQREAIELYLLAVIAGTSTDPKVLMQQAACFNCLTTGEKEALKLYLLCQIANL